MTSSKDKFFKELDSFLKSMNEFSEDLKKEFSENKDDKEKEKHPNDVINPKVALAAIALVVGAVYCLKEK